MDTNEVNRIFNRQFERCKTDLRQVNCPNIYIDTISKYFNFARKDIYDLLLSTTVDKVSTDVYRKHEVSTTVYKKGSNL